MLSSYRRVDIVLVDIMFCKIIFTRKEFLKNDEELDGISVINYFILQSEGWL